MRLKFGLNSPISYIAKQYPCWMSQ